MNILRELQRAIYDYDLVFCLNVANINRNTHGGRGGDKLSSLHVQINDSYLYTIIQYHYFVYSAKVLLGTPLILIIMKKI